MEAHDSALHIAIGGEFGIFNAVAVAEQLLYALDTADAVDVDLSGVTEMDSAGVQLMVAARREAEAHRKQLRFVAASSVVQDILGFCELSGYLDDAPSASSQV